MTATPSLDRIADQDPDLSAAAIDVDGDLVDDFAGDTATWPALGAEHTSSADAVPAQDSVHADGAAAAASGEGSTETEPVQPQVDGEFPEQLLSDAGLTAEAARQQFGTPAALEAAVSFHLQQVIHAGRQRPQTPPQPAQLPAGLQGVSPDQQPPQSTLPAGQQAGLPTKGWYKPFAEVVKSMKDHDGDPVYADETIRLIEAMDAHNASQFDALTNALGPLVMRTYQGVQQFAAERASQAVEQHYRAMEQRFAELGDEWADTFGKGDARALIQDDASNPCVQARIKVAETMEAIKQGRAKLGLQSLDDDTLFQQALRADFHSKLQDLHQRGIQDKRAGRNNLRTMRPTQRKTPSRTQNERTLQAVERMLQQRGRSLGPPSEEALSGEF